MKRYRRVRTVICCLLVLLLTILSGCGRTPLGGDDPAESSTSIVEADPESLDDITMEGLVSEVLDQMTLEQKIGQLFIVSTDSLDFNAETKMTDQMKENIEKYQPGGVIFFSFNLTTKHNVNNNRKKLKRFIRKMQKYSEVPMFISVDEECGTVARIANSDAMGTTKFPAMSEIGATGDSRQAYNVGATIGREIAELGFNLEFCPGGGYLHQCGQYGDRFQEFWRRRRPGFRHGKSGSTGTAGQRRQRHAETFSGTGRFWR